MAGIKISDLPARTSVDDTMTLAVDTGTNTYKITVGDYNHSATETARQYANQSAASATESATSAANAQNSLNQTIVVAGNAATSASNAATSATNSASSATTANGYKVDAEAWAVGKRNNVDVPNTDPAYHNNSKYYSEQSSSSATSSASSKGDSEAWAVGTRNGTPVPPSAPQYANSAKHWAKQAAAVAHVDPMDNNTMGIGKPDGLTAEATNGVFTSLGATIVATVNPDGVEFGADWLMHNGDVLTPDARMQYRVDYMNATSIWYWDGTSYASLTSAGGGHTILNSSLLPVVSRPNLRFDGMDVDDDSTNYATVVKSPIEEIPDEATWNSMSQAEKDNPNRSFYLPWMQTGDMLTHERTPVGLLAYYNGTSLPATEKDWLKCDGTVYNVSDYPKLAPICGAQAGDTTFAVPTLTSSYQDTIVVIKAKQSSNVITFADVDDEEITEDNVWSAAKVNEEIENAKVKVPKLVRTVTSKTVSTGDVNNSANFHITETKSGYTPIFATVRNNYASRVLQSAETVTMANGSIDVNVLGCTLSGGTLSITYYLDTLWQENV